MSYHAILSHVITIYHVMPLHTYIMKCHSMSSHVITSCHGVPYQVISLHVCNVRLSRVIMLYLVISCQVMLSIMYIISCHVMPYQVISLHV